MSYSTVQGYLLEDTPNFDKDMMEQKLDEMIERVNRVNQDYQQFKGEFLASYDPMICKDVLGMKLDMIKGYKGQQDAIVTKMPAHRDLIEKNNQDLDSIKGDYATFEKGLFVKNMD